MGDRPVLEDPLDVQIELTHVNHPPPAGPAHLSESWGLPDQPGRGSWPPTRDARHHRSRLRAVAPGRRATPCPRKTPATAPASLGRTPADRGRSEWVRCLQTEEAERRVP